jgi:signal transduction histidine kinase/CheY-like chemotaxis protein
MTSHTFDRRLVAVGRSLDPGEVQRSLLVAIREIAGTERNLVLLRDGEGRWASGVWDGFEMSPRDGDLAPWVAHPAFSVAVTATGAILLEPTNGAGAGRASPLAEVRAGLVVALRGEVGVVGVLLAGSEWPRVFTLDDRERLEALADHAGLAIDHARRHAEVTARSHRLVALAQATHRLSGHRPWGELLAAIAEEARQLLGAAASACRVLEGDELATAISAGDVDLVAGVPRLKVGEGLCGLVAARGTAIRVADIGDAAWQDMANGGDLARRGVRACLAVPLMARDQVVGVLSVYATERGRFDEDDEALLAGFAGHAAAAVENSRLVQQLLHAERLAAVGRIVAGVAHELNNPLAVVIGTADLLRREALESRVDERLRRISGQAQRAVKIVRSLLALARKQPTTWTTVDVNTLIEETLELEGYQFRSERVSVVRDLAPDLPGLLADANQLQQVLTNLFLNALEAMRESRGHGTLTVSTRATGADRVTVTVADDGPGIAPGNIDRVFEPFFTTKKEQKGTGLGLSICRQIVETHRGQIRVESRPDAGTTFTVELPVSRDGVERPTEPDRVGSRSREGVSVLLVEDERVVGDLLAEFLTLEGHQVDRAANGREALVLVQRREYALIVSDVRMPDLDGPALYRELSTVNPLLTRRMLFVTGDVMSPETRRFLDETRLAYLEKPFGIAEFHAAIRSVLDRQACTPHPAKSA